MEYFIQAMGVREVQRGFRAAAAAGVDVSPAMEDISVEMMAIEEQVFNSQGRRGGGSWKRDSIEWLTRKQRLGLDPRINHATLELRDSVTIPDAYGQIKRVGSHSLWFGSDLPYAEVTQRNRPFIKFTPFDRASFRKIIADYLVSAFRSGVAEA